VFPPSAHRSVLSKTPHHGHLRAGLDLESGFKNGLGSKKSTPLIGGEVGTRTTLNRLISVR
jgi:hypothetical protein